ncbi:FadR/GntR family transcriptional regulator [Piscinibacter sp. XHJ-5]|uniref:FadR/GntR family transcriptional regulator n=1 Tax=Piscinibacter sp. XHJ-5 TaxID=3037797 RepID=UPI0024532BD1|nr:FadR/GntR family transcriptional regulator [Piscinibacter sp. XHJ-5]
MSEPRLQPIEPRRLYRHIAEVIARHIDAGEFPPGTLLPPERELAQQLGVSRASVREGLIALEVQGRVSVRVGNGVTVLPPPTAAQRAVVAAMPASDWPEVGPLDVVEARRIIEAETAALAAARITDADLVHLEATLQGMEQGHVKGETHSPQDRHFHLQIARISGNQALVQMVATLWDQRRSRLFAAFEEHFVTPALFDDTNRDHRRIFEALKARDPKAARVAMRQHLNRVHREYSRAL